jgi:peptide/nickel transport system permease protein
LELSLGVLAAVKKDSWMDTTAVFSSVLGISAPSFFWIIIAYLFGFVASHYTGLHMTGVYLIRIRLKAGNFN